MDGRGTKSVGLFSKTLVVALLLLSSSSRAEPPNESATARFRDGAAAYARGDFRDAASAFEDAYRAAPHPAATYNAGLAWEKAGEAARAADAYDASLRAEGLSEAQKRDARTRLERLERTLGRVDVSAPAGGRVSVAHVRDGAVPLHAHLAPGENVVTLRTASGETTERRIDVPRGAVIVVVFEAAPPRSTAPPVEPVTAPMTPPSAAPPPSPITPSDASPPPRKLVGYASLGTAAAAAGVAIYLGLRAVSARDAYAQTGYRDQGQYDHARSLRLSTNVSWGVAAGLGVLGGVLILTSPSTRAEVSLSPRGVETLVRF